MVSEVGHKATLLCILALPQIWAWYLQEPLVPYHLPEGLGPWWRILGFPWTPHLSWSSDLYWASVLCCWLLTEGLFPFWWVLMMTSASKVQVLSHPLLEFLLIFCTKITVLYLINLFIEPTSLKVIWNYNGQSGHLWSPKICFPPQKIRRAKRKDYTAWVEQPLYFGILRHLKESRELN